METMILLVAVAFTVGGLCGVALGGVALGVAIGLTGKDKGEDRDYKEE